MNRVQVAKARLVELVDSLASSRDAFDTTGNLTEADFDELQHISLYLQRSLPKKFHKLLSDGHTNRSSSQRSLGQRLNRILSIEEKFPLSVSEFDATDVTPTFTLADAEKERIFLLCTQMRKIVFASEVFDAPHKKRLLDRIAAIEKQVYQEKGLLDVVLGGVSDVGETVNKFGNDIKPLTDRMAEVMKIARSGSKEYEQLPEPEEIAALPKPEEDGE